MGFRGFKNPPPLNLFHHIQKQIIMKYQDLIGSNYLSKGEINAAYNELVKELEFYWEDFAELRAGEGIEIDVEMSDHGDFNLDYDDFVSYIDKYDKEEIEIFFDFHEDVNNYHGDNLVSESEFVNYTEEFTKESYSFDPPDWVVIDWEQTAEELKYDYTEIEWSGCTYYMR